MDSQQSCRRGIPRPSERTLLPWRKSCELLWALRSSCWSRDNTFHWWAANTSCLKEIGIAVIHYYKRTRKALEEIAVEQLETETGGKHGGSRLHKESQHLRRQTLELQGFKAFGESHAFAQTQVEIHLAHPPRPVLAPNCRMSRSPC
mmetsp:Transcript_27120/g.41009  ORF Transcript_27120/g.41009 Transcript_27120/m.41009 type:complete len:147 (-) Transcript_27120:40-480(-)